jgi:hypothetical protein
VAAPKGDGTDDDRGNREYLASGMIRGIGLVCPNVERTFYETFDISVEEPIAIKSRPRNERIAPHRYN